LCNLRVTVGHQTLVTAVEQIIFAQHIQVGQIGQQLGVSRTPLREAIKYLASEGLVELVPARGAVVKQFGAREVRDMLEVIRMLEQQAGLIACAQASDAGIAQVRALHDRMLDCYQRRDRLAYYKLNQAIHSAIVALADNGALSEVHSRLQTRLKRIRFIGHEGPERWAHAVAEHEAIIAALEARDADGLSAILGRHLTQAWERVRHDLPQT